MIHVRRWSLPVALLGFSLWIPAALAQAMEYPKARKGPQVDTYHGVQVADPYRWLEDDRSAETAQWVAEENKITFAYLDKILFRKQLKARLQALYNYPRFTAPFRRGEHFFFTRNDGLQNQDVVYIQKGLDGPASVLLDPNKFSVDGTSRLGALSVSRDGRYAVYTISSGGSDWQEASVLEIATRKVLPERLKWLKVSDLAWAGDGFYYSRYDAPAPGHELSSRNDNHKVYRHKVGTPQAQDELLFEDKAHPQRFHNARTSEDQRFLYLTISERGKGKDGNALYYRDLTKATTDFTPIVSEITDERFAVITNIGDKFLIRTNRSAPNEKVVQYDPANPTEPWKDLAGEKPTPMQGASAAGGKLFLSYMEDVASRVYVCGLDGKVENEIALPGAGIAGGFGGNFDDKQVFYSFTSLTFPSTLFRYDIAEKKTSLYRSPEIPTYSPAAYETRQAFYHSTDGTRVPMFLVYKKGLKLDGSNPTLLSGYGGFNLTTFPTFNSMRLALLEQGFVYASANIRGGGEYGEKWHQAGMKLNKQNVFDDFIAAAEWLISSGYTSKEKLAIQGGSNGGLLVGAVINQRPELFRAAIAEVGVMDMLRFHKFTIGWNWIADYGSSENPEEFKAIYRYSPLHNIRAGGKYPAVFITTADHDDRVVPAHSFKYAATMQERASRDNPVLIRIETKSGHGSSSTSKNIEKTADIDAFLMHTLGVKPKL